MGAMLRLMIPACPAIPLLGGHEVVGGCIALTLENIRERMLPRLNRLAESYSLPPDPAALPATFSETSKQERLRYELSRHQEYLRLSAAVVELEDALRRSEDLEVTAVLFTHGRTEMERWSGFPILNRQFVWAECRACARRYTPEECDQSQWSRVADPRAGIGGGCLACPAGHVIFAKQTWVA